MNPLDAVQSQVAVNAVFQLHQEGDTAAASEVVDMTHDTSDLSDAMSTEEDGEPSDEEDSTESFSDDDRHAQHGRNNDDENVSSDAALAGKDGKQLAVLLKQAKDDGIAVMRSTVTDALRRYSGYGPLLTNSDEIAIARSIAGVNSMADLLARARVHEMADQVNARKGGLHRFADAPRFAFAEQSELPINVTPSKALSYFSSLIPKLGIDPERFPGEQRRKAFTVARSSNVALTSRIQNVLQGGLAGNRPGADVAADVDTLLDELGCSSSNPQYSDMVYRTNAMDIYNTASHEEGLHPDIADTFPCWEYMGIEDGREGDDHRPHFGKYYPPSKTFADARGPRPWNCRCCLRWVDKYEWEELQSSGKKMETK